MGERNILIRGFNVCNFELVKRYAIGSAFLLFCMAIGWLGIAFTVGSNQLGSYIAGIIGGVVTGFFVLYYEYAILRYKKKKNR